MRKVGAFVRTITDSGFALVEEVPVLAVDPYHLNCTVYLYGSEDDAIKGQRSGGSGCLVGMASRHPPHFYPHVVTNAHVVDHGYRYVRLNKKGGDVTVIATKPEDWLISQNDDLAAFGTYFPPGTEAVSIGTDIFIDETCAIDGWAIYPGDEAFFYGRFIEHDGRQRNKPVMRFGNIAMMPDATTPVRVNDRDQVAFLVECRSLSGFSGSPAFVKLAPTRLPAPGMNLKGRGLSPSYPAFLGIDCGHFPFWSNVYHKNKHGKPGARYEDMCVETNSGIAVVIPAWRVLHLLNQEPLVSEREAEERKRDKNASTVILDTTDASPSEQHPFTKDDFEDALKRVSRKLSDEEKSET